MDIYETIIRPLVTEKSSHQTTFSNAKRGGAYTFQVQLHASKGQIKDAIEKIYGVKVLSVRTAVRRGEHRRFRTRMGMTSSTKRAVVVLHPDSHIDLFS